MFKNFGRGFILGFGFLCAIAFALLFAGCNRSDPKTEIIGKWQQAGIPGTFQFFESGDVNVISGAEEASTKYLWVDDSHIRIGPENYVTAIWEVHIKGDMMTLKNATRTETWKRIE